MNTAPKSLRVPLRNGVAHYVDGLVRLRRFRKLDQGGADFIIRGPAVINALLVLESDLSQRSSQITKPECVELSGDYAAYWTPAEKLEGLVVTFAHEPHGLPVAKSVEFSLPLSELQQIASAIRALLANAGV